LSLDDLSARLRTATRQKRLTLSSMLDSTSRFARFPLLLAHHLFAIAYLNAGVSKLWIGGWDWLNGYTLQYYMLRSALETGGGIGAWLGQYHTIAILLSWLTIFFELTFFLVLFFPALLWVYVPLGLSLHLGMCMSNIACFVEYFGLYVVFVSWDSLLRQLSSIPRRETLQIYFDGECVLCIRSMTLLHYCDWFHRLAYVDMRNTSPGFVKKIEGTSDPAEMLMLRPDGALRRGFFAWREILWQLPVLWPLSALLWIPGMSQVGPWVYKRIAQSRSRFGTCHDGACSAGWR